MIKFVKIAICTAAFAVVGFAISFALKKVKENMIAKIKKGE